MGKAFKTIFGTALIGLTVAGCSDFKARPFANNESFVEGGQTGEPLENFTAEQIYQRGEYELANKKPEKAATYFGEIERLYPYSEWAKRALIMQAFAFHQDKDYENSRASAQRYIDFYPADEDAAYAQYLLALSYYDQIDDVGRDQGLTFQALQALRTVIERYPDSEYAESAILQFDLAFDHLAGKEMEVGRYYLKQGHYTSAINRFRVVVEDFQTTTHTAEALHRLVESYLSLGLTDEAQTAGAILGYNYQGSEWYADTYKLLTDAGLKPEAKGDSWLAKIYRQMIKGEWL
ncbi:outer membrane protein assembly factor BamD [Donghicola sp. C2-DW-16]|uniref:Outer membrane protein assembly factor BamD n=2 Tax=Donghicola mangrovi TaxID=2729614 RepID=A0A850QAJ5_9RHOB|nr:outer membrane protein assembly factor BamD [Donghicola mangrovi]NVO23495.1 outer membrane protein assembly factor BamD [Donghicola mangrovi]NVO27047.1 outer membrane protein assembly factor BamD [Donghicola mangrovi]